MKQRALQLLRRTGTEAAARSVQRRLRPRWARQNDADDAALARLLPLALARDGNCVDVGANIGDVLTGMVAAAPDGRHVAFEPVPALAQALAQAFPGVEVRCEAVGAERGQEVFAVHQSEPALSGLRQSLSHQLTADFVEVVVPVVRLDDVLLPRPRTAFLKVDVEGGELQAFRGARELLRRDRPLVAFEHGHGSAVPDLAFSAAVFDELAAARLDIFLLEGTRLDRARFLEVYRAGTHWNFLAHG